MHNVQVFPLIGLPQFNGWSQVVVAQDNQLILSLAVTGQNAGNIGRDLVAQIQNKTITDGASFYALLQQLVEIAQTLDVSLACAAAFVEAETVTYATYNGTLILKRSSKVGIALTSQDKLRVIQGTLDPEDVVILATNSSQNFFGEIQQKATQGYGAQVIMKSLINAVHADPNGASMALAFVSFEPLMQESDPAMVSMTQTYIESTPEHMVVESLQVTETPGMVTAEASYYPDTISPDIPLAQTTPAAITPPVAAPSAASPVIRSAGSAVSGVSRALGRLVSVLIARIRRQPSDVYVSQSSAKNLTKVIAPVLIVVGIALVLFFIWRTQRAAQVTAAETAMQPIITTFIEAKEKVSSDPLVARDTMQQSIQELEALHKNLASQPVAQEHVNEALTEIIAEFNEVSGKKEVSELPVFFDLSSVQRDFLATESVASDEAIAFIDVDKKEAIVMNWTDRQGRKVDLTSLPALTDVTMDEDRLVVLGQGLRQIEMSASSSAQTELVGEGDTNRDSKLLAAYSQYLYLFNPVRRNIYRYLREGNTLSDPIGWIKPGNTLPFEDISSMSIDGDMWLGTKTGEVIKFTQGEKVDFSIVGLSQPFTSTIAVHTADEWQNLYIFEPSQERIVVISKSGQYVKEIKSTSLASVTQIAVNEPQQLALAVSGSLVFEVKL